MTAYAMGHGCGPGTTGAGPAWGAWMTGRGHRGGPGGHFGAGGAFGLGFGGPPPWFGGPWGRRGGGGFGRGPKARRGDVRAAILALLAEQARNGYQIIQEIEQRSGGYWRPSPGSIYPALQQLEDEGLIRATEAEGRKAFELTDEGRAYVEAHGDEVSAPWESMTENVTEEAHEFGTLVRQVWAAMIQVAYAGNDAQRAEGLRVLAETKRALYRILAEDEPD